MQIQNRYSRFFVSLTVFELLTFELWLSGGHEISRDHWRHVTAEGRITKFGTVIELTKTNIFYLYTKVLSLILWVPDEKN